MNWAGHLRLNPMWSLGPELDPHDLLPRTMRLLRAVDEQGSLSAACEVLQLSYRHAWGVLHEASKLLGQDLMVMERGKGTSLTALGHKLVWADRKAQAKLEPLLGDVTQDMLRDIEQLLRPGISRNQWAASPCASLDHVIKQLVPEFSIDVNYTSNRRAIDLLMQGNTQLAGFHLNLENPTRQDTHRVEWLNNPAHCRVLTLAERELGLILPSHNPLHIQQLLDLRAHPHLRWVVGQAGSTTTQQLEDLLHTVGMVTTTLNLAAPPENNHNAIAALVASGEADIGFGLRAAADRFGLHFVPLTWERYQVALSLPLWVSPLGKALVEALNNPSYAQQLRHTAGYRLAAELVHHTSPSGVE